MSILEALILGIVQGLTEFVPISSSGHLILAREVLGIESSYALSVDAVLQLATALAIFAYFARELRSILKDKTFIKILILATIPAVIAGLLLEDVMATTFRSVELVAWTLMAGALLMYLAEHFGKQDKTLTMKRGVVVGFFQSLALVPGVSRSGATISGGMLAGLTRESATKFSFMLAFPILLGSGVKKLLDLYQANALEVMGFSILVGSVVAFLVGVGAIHFLLKYLKSHKLTVFIWYRVVLALLILVFIA